jgi:FKBP-type peptidyl-prolyl cis-trans isomerase FkpA
MTFRRPSACARPRTGIVLLASSLIVVASLLVAGATTAKTPESEEDRTVYLIGATLAQQLGPLYLTEKEMNLVVEGLKDAYEGKAEKLDPAVYGPKLRLLQEERTKKGLVIESKKSATYIADQKKESGAKVTDSGLIITEVEAGTGAQPTAEQKVSVQYTGRLRDGTIFDSSVQRGEPAEFPLSGVIPCWSEGVSLMKVGGKAKLVCPAELAYGERGIPGTIPPGAALTFDVELLGIVE